MGGFEANKHISQRLQQHI